MRRTMSTEARRAMKLPAGMTAAAVAFFGARANEKALIASPNTLTSAKAAEAQDSAAVADRFLIVPRGLGAEAVRLAAIDSRTIEYRVGDGSMQRMPIDQCVALVSLDEEGNASEMGILELADGQRLPGQAISGQDAASDSLVWDHPTLGRLRVPLDRIRAVAFLAGARPPGESDADAVLLTNGDRIEGFVIALGDPIVIDMVVETQTEQLEIPRERVESVRLVTPRQTPVGRRVWLTDGSIVDVQQLLLTDDGFVRLTGLPLVAGDKDVRLRLTDIAAVLFDPAGLSGLAQLKPNRIDGPSTRYSLPAPKLLQASEAPLGLADVEIRGPIRVRYALPSKQMQFAAEAVLPPSAREWGDFDLIIRVDDREVLREHLSADRPVVAINTELRGSQLTIELAEGAYGPIDDRIILRRAMLLAE